MTDPLAPGLGDSQRALLEVLKRRGPATVAELEPATALARESVRDHLRALAAAGLVERAGVRRAGAAGRPAALYRLSARAERLFPQREPELLRELAAFLVAEDGGRTLARFFTARGAAQRRRLAPTLAGLPSAERAGAVAAIFTAEGFAAEAETGADGRCRLRLCHCPLRELVAVSQLPCRAELELAEDLLGTRLRRESFIPDGAPSCTYSFAPPPERRPALRRRRRTLPETGAT